MVTSSVSPDRAETIVANPAALAAAKAARVREIALVAQDVDEDAVASFLVQLLDRCLEDAVVIHGFMLILARRPLTPLAGEFQCE